jgi:hypothetical protein
VALDHTAWQMLEHKRVEAGLPAAHALGTNDPASIHLLEI